MTTDFKRVQFEAGSTPQSWHLTLTGKLRKEDYDDFVPAIEELIGRHGKLNLLVELVDFHGWSAGALWEDTKFDLKHFDDINRLAIVGDKKWEKAMAMFCKPFTTAKVRYFDISDIDEAKRWTHIGKET